MPTVNMVRDAAAFPDSHEATVEAEEADAWKEAGWTEAPADEPPARTRKGKAADEPPAANAAAGDEA